MQEGGYLVTCPAVPGLLTDGATLEEALANVPDAVQTLIEAMQAKGVPLPPALQQVDVAQPIQLETLVAVP
jgi:predicted RNase H-like HicB family nuclease